MKRGNLINRFKFGGHLIEMYQSAQGFYAVVDSKHSTKQTLTGKKAFNEAITLMEGTSMKVANELREIASSISKIALSPSQIIRKIEKEVEATLDEAYVTERSHPGSYHYPPEAGEIEVKNAYIESFPQLTIEEAELLPNKFECAVVETFRDEELNEEADVRLFFEVTIESKNIQPNGKVEIEFKDRFIGWEYD